MKNVLTTAAVIAVTLIAVPNSLKAQDLTGGIYVSPSLPLGDFGDAVGFGIGGGVQLDYFVEDQFSIGVEAGYNAFMENDTEESGTIVNTSASIVPILAKGTFYFQEGEFMPYGSLGLGYYLINTTTEIGSVEGSASDGAFGISPRLGFQYEMGSALWFNINANYNLLFNGESTEVSGVTIEEQNTSYIGLNVGIVFMLAD